MSDDPTAGTVYLDHVNKLLDAEFERRKVLEARGDSIIKTSAGIIALVVALSAFASGKDYKFSDHWDSIGFLLLASIFFIASAGLAIYVQSWALESRTTSSTTLDRMTQDLWSLSADDARRMCLKRLINSTVSLREGNAKKVSIAQYAIILQAIAIALLAISVMCELASRS